MRTRMRGLAAACVCALLVALLLALAGCLGRVDDRPAPPSGDVATGGDTTEDVAPEDDSPTDDSPTDAYVAWLDALRRQDAVAACARHAPELTIALRYRAILEDRAELGDPCTGFVAVLWEDPAREYEPEGVEETQVTSERARLAVDFAGVDESVRLERRDGAWFVAETAPRVDAADGPGRWLDAWCALSLGLDRTEVVAAMGEPSGEYTVTDGGEPQLYWARRQYDFRAYLDPRGRVVDLVGDYDALSAADRRRLPCPELR